MKIAALALSATLLCGCAPQEATEKADSETDVAQIENIELAAAQGTEVPNESSHTQIANKELFGDWTGQTVVRDSNVSTGLIRQHNHLSAMFRLRLMSALTN